MVRHHSKCRNCNSCHNRAATTPASMIRVSALCLAQVSAYSLRLAPRTIHRHRRPWTQQHSLRQGWCQWRSASSRGRERHACALFALAMQSREEDFAAHMTKLSGDKGSEILHIDSNGPSEGESHQQINGSDSPNPLLDYVDFHDELDHPTTHNSEAIDDFWASALQSSLVNQKTNVQSEIQKNRRMQMFAFLSQPIIEVQVIGLVLLSCLLVAINTLEDLPWEVRQGINIVDTICVYIFAVEFFLRWWSAGRLQWRYLAKPLVSIDAVVVILPLILSGLLPIWDFGVMTGIFPGVSLPGWLIASSSANSALLNLRLLRILKFQRVLTDEITYMKFEMALGMKKRDVRPYQLQLARVLISIFTLVSVSTGLIYAAEHEVNPAIPDYFTALYFGLTTLTTVGFGDITPVTSGGRLIVGSSILAGVAVIPAQAASLAEAYLDFQKERSVGKRKRVMNEKKSDIISKTRSCKSCGAGFHRHDALFCWSCGEPLKF